QGQFTLLRDTRTDGSFLVHHFLSFYLRAGCKVCFVALLQSFSHYSVVAQKLGVSLAAAKERGQLVFLEGLKSCLDLLFGGEEQPGQPSPLQFLSSAGGSALRGAEGQNPLHWGSAQVWGVLAGACPASPLAAAGSFPSGIQTKLELRWGAHPCLLPLQGNVVVLVHSNEDSEDEENELVVNSLCHHSDLILWAEGLATGFCKDVHGQVR
ncbi:ELP6 protein, partial [Leiothrix lutea]|nr:ELP6 protein [Leiothrix lutea]